MCLCDLPIDSVQFQFVSEGKAILAYNKDFERKNNKKECEVTHGGKSTTPEKYELSQQHTHKLRQC